MKEIGAAEFKILVKHGIENLVRGRERMNRINVFPVPDGDTGDNLAHTLLPLRQRIEASRQERVDELAEDFSRHILTTAKGNAGVIFSQFFLGFARAVRGKQVMRTTDFGFALEQAAEESYGAVAAPQEGTILTVIRHAAAEFKRRAQQEEYFHQVFAWVSQRTHEILEKTREMLPQLKKAHVVDAGGLGFYLFFEGMAQAAIGRHPPTGGGDDAATPGAPADSVRAEAGICAEWLIEPGGKDKAHYRSLLQALGESLVVAGDEALLHVHLHCTDPEAVDRLLAESGRIVSRKWETIYEHLQVNPPAQATLVIDSAIDLPEEFKGRSGISVIPMQVSMDGTYYREGVEISREQFYRLLVERPQMALKTSQPATGDVLAALREALGKRKPVVLFSLSSLLSGAHQGAQLAVRQLELGPHQRVLLIDTRNVSAGSGLLVAMALRRLNEGLAVEELEAAVAAARDRVVSLGYVDDLGYAVRGGRIPKPVGFLARILGLKALVAFEGGRLLKKGVTLRSRRIEKKIVAKFQKRLDPGQTYSVGIGYTDDSRVADRLESELRASGLKTAALFKVCAAAALGAHAGPGTFCLWALPEEQPNP